jgi:hypothetical protein
MTNPAIKQSFLREQLAYELNIIRRCRNQVQRNGVRNPKSVRRILNDLTMQGWGMRRFAEGISTAITLGQISMVSRYPLARKVRLPKSGTA